MISQGDIFQGFVRYCCKSPAFNINLSTQQDKLPIEQMIGRMLAREQAGMSCTKCQTIAPVIRLLRDEKAQPIQIILQSDVCEQVFMIAEKKPYSVAVTLVNHKYLLTGSRHY